MDDSHPNQNAPDPASNTAGYAPHYPSQPPHTNSYGPHPSTVPRTQGRDSDPNIYHEGAGRHYQPVMTNPWNSTDPADAETADSDASYSMANGSGRLTGKGRDTTAAAAREAAEKARGGSAAAATTTTAVYAGSGSPPTREHSGAGGLHPETRTVDPRDLASPSAASYNPQHQQEKQQQQQQKQQKQHHAGSVPNNDLYRSPPSRPADAGVTTPTTNGSTVAGGGVYHPAAITAAGRPIPQHQPAPVPTSAYAGMNGFAVGSGTGPAAHTFGPHKSDMMNRLDPRVDSDQDGSMTLGKDKAVPGNDPRVPVVAPPTPPMRPFRA